MASGKVSDMMKPDGDPRSRYELQARIGKGAYGYVCKAIDRFDGQPVAIKIINLEDAGDEVDDVHQEIAVMSNMNCNQLTKYYSSYVFGENLWIIMEYLEAGSLLDIIKEKGPLQEAHVAYIMRELLCALAYLHSERKIHRDVKAGNILVAGNGAVKLADFGVTGQLTDSIDKRQTKIGTPFWMAPEVITQSAYDGCADVWSAGITAIELSKGAPPYANRIHPYQAIMLIPKNPAPVLDGAFSENFRNFVAACLTKNPADRPSAAVLLRHPFISAVTGIPESWAAFVRSVVEERQAKAVAQSGDDTLDQSQGEVDGADWEFTMRTGVSMNSRNNSAPGSRSHSRSNSRIGMGIDASSSSSTAGGKAGGSAAPQRSISRSSSRGRPSDPSVPLRQGSRRGEDVFRTSSGSDSEGSADDILSDDDRVSPGKTRSGTAGVVPPAITTTTSSTSAASMDYEGISFPTTFPNKVRSPLLGKGSTSPAASPRLAGAPPRPKSVNTQDLAAEASRLSAQQEERIGNLQQEVQALCRENALLRSITAPYLRALDVLYQNRKAAALVQPTPAAGAATASQPRAGIAAVDSAVAEQPSTLSAAIQQAVYSAEPQQADDLAALVAGLSKPQLPATGSAAYRNIVVPTVQQLQCRVEAAKASSVATAAPASQHAVGSHGSVRPSSLRKQSGPQRSEEQAEDVLRVLMVALAGLDAFDASHPLQRLLEQKRSTVTRKGVHVVPEPIDLTAPTPKASHGTTHPPGPAVAQEDPVVVALEQAVPAAVQGLGSLDLLTLLTAYLEEDLRQPAEGMQQSAARK